VNKDFTGFTRVIKFSAVRHIVNFHSKNHENISHQKQIETENFLKILSVFKYSDSIEFQKKDKKNGIFNDRILYHKKIGYDYYVVEEIIFGNKTFSLKTMWIKK
jgi:hypothetical protein